MAAPLNTPLQEKPIPVLRSDIKIYRGPNEADGSPTFNCLDPIRAQYFKISWAEMVILEHLKPGMTLTQLFQELNHHSTLKVTMEELQGFFEEAFRNHLLDIPRSADEVLKEANQRKTHPILWVLYHYLYIRIPLLNPDQFLTKTLPLARKLVSRPALFLYFILSAIGIFRLIDRFEEFLTTFSYFFTVEGALIYASTISIVKIIHEFSHAYVAKYYKLHVPTMGIALIVLWPVLYTDVTDGWKLNKRRQRLAISFAGVASELILAGLSTLGWTLTSPGLLQSAFFVVASATWISTLAVNLNPAMRFDGYYLMSDIMGIDNLQARAFAFTRWQLRKWFLGLNIPPPEEGLSLQRRAFMISYSIYTWIYRLILYTVIAIFVYHEFTKALGIILFLVEIAFFMVPPFFSEAKQLTKLAPFMTWNLRSLLTTLALGSLAFWFIVPLPHLQYFPAITIPSENQIIYIPQEGNIEQINFTLDQQVKPGDVLLTLSSKPLRLEIKAVQADVETLQAQIHILSLKEEDRAYIPEKTAELASAQSKLKSLLQRYRLLTIKSSIYGTIYERDDTLHPNQYVTQHQVIAKIAPLNKNEVMAYVPESRLPDIKLGQPATFWLANSLERFKGHVIEISPSRETVLQYPQMASINHGELPSNMEKDGKIILLESYFPVRVALDDKNELALGLRGTIYTRGPWRSKAADFWRYVQSLFWQESSL